MTRVGFYLLGTDDAEQRLHIAARLTDKAFQRGHRVYINTADQQQAEHMNQLLWSFRPSSFLPHGLAGTDDSDRIAIGFGDNPADHDDLLINLDLQIPGFFSRFTRVAELVSRDPASLKALREAWQFYKQRGYPLEKHDL